MQLDISLNQTSRRPIARLNWFSGCLALIDTGALFPVWTKSESLLIKLGGRLQKRNVSFSGFGGETYGHLYRVNFNLNGLQYIYMPIVVKPMENLNCHIIISATMFENMIYTIDTINKKLSIDTADNQVVRILKLSNEQNNLSVYLAGTYETVQDYQDRTTTAKSLFGILPEDANIEESREKRLSTK